MKTILVVDDESANAEVLALVLADEGYRVACASNGAEALAKIDEIKPDLVVLDMMMPVMDGAETAEHMRACAKCRDIKILLNSSLSEQAVRERFAGFDGYLRKPYQLEDVLVLIDRLLNT